MKDPPDPQARDTTVGPGYVSMGTWPQGAAAAPVKAASPWSGLEGAQRPGSTSRASMPAVPAPFACLHAFLSRYVAFTLYVERSRPACNLGKDPPPLRIWIQMVEILRALGWRFEG